MSKNFATSTVVIPPIPATSGLTLTVLPGTGSRFVAGKAASIVQTGGLPTPATGEVVWISSISGDTLTIIRAQESSSARTVRIGDTILQGPTASMWDNEIQQLATPRLLQVPGRMAMERAIADRGDRALTMLFVGASTMEGSVASNSRSLAVQLGKMMQSALNPTGINGGYGIKVRAWETTTGTTGEVQDIDFMKHRTFAIGATAVHTTLQPVTGVRIQFLEGPLTSAGGTVAGSFTVTLANSAGSNSWTVVPNPAAATDSPTGVWTSPVLARAVYTVTIAAIGVASIGNSLFFDGDHTLGLRFYNCGRAGGRTQTFIDTASFWTRLAAVQPDIVFTMLGFNDMGASVSQATYGANLTTIVDQIQAAVPSKRVWIPLIAQHSFETTVATWAPYKATMQAVAASRPANCTYHDFGQSIPTLRTQDPNFEIVFTDDTHMTSLGHTIAAGQVGELFSLGHRRTLPANPPVADNLAWDWKTDPNLQAYYDPNALPDSIGASISSLPVSNGVLTNALTQATGSKQPTVVAGPNSRKALHFVSASSQELATTTFGPFTTPATMVAILRRWGSSGTRAFSGVSSTFLSFQITSGSPYLLRLDTGTAPSASTTWVGGPDAAWHIAIVVYNGANSLLYFDSRTPVTMALAAAQVNWNGLSLGRNQTASAFSDCETAGLAAFNRQLTTFEVGRVFDSLSAACNIYVAP